MKRLLPFLLVFLFILPAISSNVCEVGNDSCEIPEDNEPKKDNDEIMPHELNQVCIIYFYGEGCHNCAKLEPFIKEIKDEFGEKVHFNKLEVYHNLNNYHLYNNYCNIKNLPLEERGVPFIAIGHKYFMGVSEIENNLRNEINELLESGERVCPLTEEEGIGLCGEMQSSSDKNIIPGLEKTMSIPLIITTGLIDGINPCAFAVLIFLIGFLVSISSTKRRMIKAGSVYILSVYISYFLAGFGLLSIIQFTGISNIIVKIAAVIAVLTGLINIKDFFWYGKGISLKIPESKKPIIERWTRKANIPAAIVLGFLVSMFELPCTGGVYLAILAMLADTVTKAKAVSYLILYNLMFVLPLIIILFAVILGMKAEHIESWRRTRKNWMKLIMGLLLLGLGIAMLLGWF